MGDSVTDSKVTKTSTSGNSGLGFRSFMRWLWGQLTSMRTALILLFACAGCHPRLGGTAERSERGEGF